MDDYERVFDMKEYQVTKCTWSLDKAGEKSPHHYEPLLPQKKIYDNVLELIGNSPMVRLNRIPKSMGIKCDIVAKCEFFLPGGSTKDRIGRRMILDAEKDGIVGPGSTIIEATSGNTGIGITLTAAVKGYDAIITLPDKMSSEKNDVLLALGAEVVRTPTSAPTDGPDSHLGVARKLLKEVKNSVLLDQYVNPGNAVVHYDHTGEEIWEQCEGHIDYCIIGTGTGGTMTGVARKLKEKNKNIQIIGVDPYGSILAHKDNMDSPDNIEMSYKVEGTGYDFFPKVFDFNCVDKWYKTRDQESFLMARRLIREEGLLVGGSSGAALVAALDIAKDLSADKRVVVILPDSIRNYMTKYLNNDWMLECGFYSQDDYDRLTKQKYQEDKSFGKTKTIAELKLDDTSALKLSNTLEDAINIFSKQSTEYSPVLNEKGELVGAFTLRHLTFILTQGKFTKKSLVKDSYIKDNFKVLSVQENQSRLSRAFGRHQYVIISDNGNYKIAEAKHLLNSFNASS